MFITLSTNLMATNYMVSGAGTAAVNGTYTPDGVNDYGLPRWKHSGGVYYLHSQNNIGMGFWTINEIPDYAGEGYYYNWSQDPFTGNIPPFTGWQVVNGEPDAPKMI